MRVKYPSLFPIGFPQDSVKDFSRGSSGHIVFFNKRDFFRAFISGQVDFIRIGYAYLAIVNEKGSAGALWIPSADSSGGNWVENKNPQQLLALKKCVNIRQGNSVPEIVGIPFNHPIHDDTQDKKGGGQWKNSWFFLFWYFLHFALVQISLEKKQMKKSKQDSGSPRDKNKSTKKQNKKTDPFFVTAVKEKTRRKRRGSYNSRKRKTRRRRGNKW